MSWEDTASMNPWKIYVKMSNKWPKIKSSRLGDFWENSRVNEFLLLNSFNSGPNTNYFPQASR